MERYPTPQPSSVEGVTDVGLEALPSKPRPGAVAIAQVACQRRRFGRRSRAWGGMAVDALLSKYGAMGDRAGPLRSVFVVAVVSGSLGSLGSTPIMLLIGLFSVAFWSKRRLNA